MFMVMCTCTSGWCCAAGGIPVSEGRIPHSLQEVVSGDRRCQTSLCPRQPGFCHGAAALGYSTFCDHRSTCTRSHDKTCLLFS